MFLKEYWNSRHEGHYLICNVVSNSIDYRDFIEKVELFHTLATPSSNIRIDIIVTHAQRNGIRNAYGMTNIELTAFNNCGTSCLNNITPVCNADKSCSGCISDADCSDPLAPSCKSNG